MLVSNFAAFANSAIQANWETITIEEFEEMGNRFLTLSGQALDSLELRLEAALLKSRQLLELGDTWMEMGNLDLAEENHSESRAMLEEATKVARVRDGVILLANTFVSRMNYKGYIENARERLMELSD